MHVKKITGLYYSRSNYSTVLKQSLGVHSLLFRLFRFSILIGMALSIHCLETLPTGDFYEPPCDNAVLKNRPHPAIGNYNVYYGSFHNHSALSDGTGTPEEAYRYAKCVAGLDFFGLSDHDASQTSESFSAAKSMAASYNADSIFATFWGFEWTSGNYGHATVINTEDFISAANPQTQTFQQLCSWLLTQNGFAILNHPGAVDANGTEFDHFQDPVCRKIVGMELWNKNLGFSYFFYTDGYDSNDNFKGYYDEALTRGWKIGAAGGFDDHNATWGTAHNYRVAVLAKNLTRQDIFEAMVARRFFSTLDKNIALSFTINDQEMGSTITCDTTTRIKILASDDDNEFFSEAILFDRNHTMRRIWNLKETSVTIEDTLNIARGDYYYLKITQQDGDEAISSPIWVSDSIF
jgi:hypothetical protein